MFMKKGLMTRTIILIILGVLVLIFLGYWAWKSQKTEELTFQECRVKWMEWCIFCATKNWDLNVDKPTIVTKCDVIVEKGLGLSAGTLSGIFDCEGPASPNDAQTICETYIFIQ